MKRLCLIGNSHLASLKLGWDRLRAAHPDMSLTFFGSRRGDACKGMRLVEGALVPATPHGAEDLRWTSGGSEEIRLDEFDRFVVVALGIRPQRVTDIAREFSFADSRLDQSKRLISRECFKAAVVDALLVTAAATIARTIRAAGKPVLLLPSPRTSIEVMKTEEFRAAYGAAPRQCWALLNALWTECATEVAAGLSAEMMFQPAATVIRHMFSPHEYCRGSIKLMPGFSTKHGDEDLSHMNADYGAVVLQSILDRMR